ncbi:MAG: hypothetical protein M1823_001460 [Watsoniomyces obsoletus]|nr:MAG: hypothetical protein M1823_001460 [Watsoniomyces obsoletus]
MTLRGQSKVDRTIAQLDATRCRGEWHEVPAVLKKVEQYAPHRRCLIETARAEYQTIILLAEKKPGYIESIRQLLIPLEAAVSSEKVLQEDLLEAQVCQAWIRWTLDEEDPLLSLLPASLIHHYVSRKTTAISTLGWTTVCALKGVVLLGSSYEQRGETSQALETYASSFTQMTPNLDPVQDFEKIRWLDRILERYSLLAGNIALRNPEVTSLRSALHGYRLWAGLETKLRSGHASPIAYPPARRLRSRRPVHKSYFALLSMILQHRWSYPPVDDSNGPSPPHRTNIDGPSKSVKEDLLPGGLFHELRRVQEKYESLLLAEVPFPRADEFNEEVEEWAEMAMRNWAAIAVRGWGEDFYLEDGKWSMTRSALDVQYRAAARTFDSTSIRRHLFFLHTSLGEYDVAFKALDTYIEIAAKRKARVKKLNSVEHGLDSDILILQTVAEGIKDLCLRGGARGVERSREIGRLIERWLTDTELARDGQNGGLGNGSLNLARKDLDQPAPHPVFAIGYRVIGISQAYSARLPAHAPDRLKIRNEAASSLRKSLSTELGEPRNLDSSFALGVLLAESLELDEAIDVVKRAIIPYARDSLSSALGISALHDPAAGLKVKVGTEPLKENAHRLLPLWHLLILLLSAKEQYHEALGTCDLVLGYFASYFECAPRPAVHDPLGAKEHGTFDRVRSAGSVSRNPEKEIISDDEIQGKESLLRIKMTQLALIELLDDAQAAVNTSSELLSLYVQVFGDPKDIYPASAPLVAPTLQPPKSSSRTVRSLGGSFMLKNKGTRSLLRRSRSGVFSSSRTSSIASSRPQTEDRGSSIAPVIQVTAVPGSNSAAGEKGGHHLPWHRESSSSPAKKLHRRSGSMQEGQVTRNFSRKIKPAPAPAVGSVTSEPRPNSSPAPDSNHVLAGLPSMVEGRLTLSEADRVQSPQAATPSAQASQTGETQPQSSDAPSFVSSARANGFDSGSDAPMELVSRAAGVPSLDGGASPRSSHEQPGVNEAIGPTRQDHQLLQPIRWISPAQLKHFKTGLLVRCWLLIAGLYRRAALYEDAKESIDEASKLTRSQDAYASDSSFGHRRSSAQDWIPSCSLDELWADILAERGYLSQAQSEPRQALVQFEAALLRYADHQTATVGLCNMLLDTSSQSPSPPSNSASPYDRTDFPGGAGSSFTSQRDDINIASIDASQRVKPSPSALLGNPQQNPSMAQDPEDPTLELDRLAARDRAYGSLVSLTQLGAGWDNSDAWLALARAHELSGELDKAREVLWRCVELEDKRPIRHWRNAATRGYVL